MDPALLDMIRQFGLPTGLLLILCFALWRVTVWFGTTVVQPMCASHLKFIQAVQDGQAEGVKISEQHGETLEKLALASDKHTENLGRLVAVSAQQGEMLAQQHEMLAKIVQDRRAWAESQQKDKTTKRIIQQQRDQSEGDHV